MIFDEASIYESTYALQHGPDAEMVKEEIVFCETQQPRGWQVGVGEVNREGWLMLLVISPEGRATYEKVAGDNGRRLEWGTVNFMSHIRGNYQGYWEIGEGKSRQVETNKAWSLVRKIGNTVVDYYKTPA